MSSNWINFVKRYARDHDISYKDALKDASRVYKKGSRRSSIKAKKISKKSKSLKSMNKKSISRKKRSMSLKGMGMSKIVKKKGKSSLNKKYYKLGNNIGTMINRGGASNKGALASLLQGLEARVNIK